MSGSTRPWGELVELTVDRVTSTVEGMHQAIAAPWFRLAGPAEPLVRTVATAHTAFVYRGVKLIGRLVGQVTDQLREQSDAHESPSSDAVMAFTNALWGDELERSGSSLAITATVRNGSGEAVTLTGDSVRRTFPDATGRVVVLLHGLGQTERCFAGRDQQPGLAEALATPVFTPVAIRYNSGREVAANGASIADLLEHLVSVWPTTIEEFVLVGYSMGGLVARSAMQAGLTTGGGWVGKVRHIVTIATPHDGSPIESAAKLTARALGVVPQTRALGEFVALRSSGIRDLGSGVDLPASFAGVHQHVIAGAVTRDPSNPIASVFGDTIVRLSSAGGRGTELQVTDRTVLGSRRHFDILRDQTIAPTILGWLD